MMFGTCTSCGHDSIPGSPPPDGRLSVDEEINAILVETMQLDNLILQIHEYRARRNRRLSALRSATIKLPPEILSHIFQHYLPQPRFDTFTPIRDDLLPERGPVIDRSPSTQPLPHSQVVVLGAVCGQWRQVAYSTPQLWRVAEIKVQRTSIKAKANLIRLYLGNVGDISLSLKLDAPLPSDYLSEVELEPVFRAVCEGTGKIKQLISTLNFGSRTAELVSHRFERLEELALIPSTRLWEVLWEVDLFSSPPEPSQSSSLKHLMLKGILFRVPAPEISYRQCSITILDLDHRDLVICARLLILCPNLIEYRVRPTTGVQPCSYGSPIACPIVFKHMRRFIVYCAFQQPFSEILPKLHLPALEELGLGATDPPDQMQKHVLTFLGRLRESSSSWSALDLNVQISKSIPTINGVLCQIPRGVTTLSLLFDDTQALTNVLTCLQGINPDGNVHMQGLRRVCFLYFHAYDTRPRGASVHSEVIVNMLTARSRIGIDMFILEMKYDRSANWRGLREVFSQNKLGFRVQIQIAGRIIKH